MVTVDELNDLAYLPGEIAHIKREIKALTRPPYQTCVATCQKTECVGALIETIETLQERLRKSAEELEKLRAFLDGIGDPFTLELFQLRYAQALEWERISLILARRGFRYSGESLRRMCQRYLERCNSEAKPGKERAAVEIRDTGRAAGRR